MNATTTKIIGLTDAFVALPGISVLASVPIDFIIAWLAIAIVLVPYVILEIVEKRQQARPASKAGINAQNEEEIIDYHERLAS